jgi:hypothetical protein
LWKVGEYYGSAITSLKLKKHKKNIPNASKERTILW